MQIAWYGRQGWTEALTGLGQRQNDKMSTRQVGKSFRSGVISDLQGLFCLASKAGDIGS